LLKLSKVLVMLVRLAGVVAIVLGIAVSTGRGLPLLNAHIGLGFVVALCLLLLAIIALTRGILGLGIVGLVLAVLLPVAGFLQFPLKFGTALGATQIGHVVIVLASLGIAEALAGGIRRRAA